MTRSLAFVAALALVACGKQGPLYLPPQKPAPPHAAHHGTGPRP